MELDFDKIIRIRKNQKRKIGLVQGRKHPVPVRSCPTRSSYRDSQSLHTSLIVERGCKTATNTVIQRKKFIFIVLYLYSPSSLAGDKMAPGLRDELSNVLGVQAKSTISNNCANLVFLYQNYTSFRKDVEYLCNKIISWLKSHESVE